MKRILSIVLCLFVTCTFVGCNKESAYKEGKLIKNLVSENKKCNKESVFKKDWYLSMTTSEGTDDDLYIRSKIYNFSNNELIEHDRLPRSSQYALCAYDAFSDCIYYSNRNKPKHEDQLWVYENKTKKRLNLLIMYMQ